MPKILGVAAPLHNSQMLSEILTNADPSLTFTHSNRMFDLFAGYAMKHQFLFQTGFSDAGLPSEFWIPADRDLKPQRAHDVNVGGTVNLFRNRYKVSVNLFFKQLYNQVEYFGSILDYANTEYNCLRAQLCLPRRTIFPPTSLAEQAIGWAMAASLTTS